MNFLDKVLIFIIIIFLFSTFYYFNYFYQYQKKTRDYELELKKENTFDLYTNKEIICQLLVLTILVVVVFVCTKKY